MATFSVILPAAGKSSRFGDAHYKKPFAPLDGRPVWLHSAERFVNRDDVKQVILVIAPEDREHFQSKFAGSAALLGVQVVEGGDERFASVENGLARVDAESDFVAIHDAARPCIASAWIDRVFADAQQSGAAILAIPVPGTLKKAHPGKQLVERTLSRTDVWEAQTPQVFRKDWLLDAFAKRGDQTVTDEAQLVELAGYEVRLSQGSPINLKITTKEDLHLAQQALRALPKPKLDAAHPFEDNDHWR